MYPIILNEKSENLTLDEVFQKYINRKKALNISDKTAIYYNNCFKYFCEFFNQNSLAINITQDIYYRIY